MTGYACCFYYRKEIFVANVAYPKFVKRRWETADPGILEGTVMGEASVMAD
jgi:hypothetical protein